MVGTTKRLRFGAGAAAFLALSGCARAPQRVSREFFTMGTTARVTVYHANAGKAQGLMGEAFREIEKVDERMSLYKAESELSLMNARADGESVEVSRELWEVMTAATRWSERTEGAFDVTVGPLAELWGFYTERGHFPDKAELAAALGKTGWRRVRMDGKVRSVAFEREGMRVDLGAIAKGYAVDRCASALRSQGVRSALIDLGGNLYAIGAPPGKEAWEASIRDPLGRDLPFERIALRDRAAATSGNYEKFVVLDGKKYGHVFDPRTGLPAEGVLSVTAIAATAMDADALSTASFVLGPEGTERLLKNIEAGFIFALPDGKGFIVKKSGALDVRGR